MSGAMRKMGVYLGLLEDIDGDYAELDGAGRAAGSDAVSGDSDQEHTAAVARPSRRRPARDSRPVADISERRRSQPAVTPVPEAGPVRAVAPLSRITTLHPRTYNDARVVGENFRDGIPVIMNLTEMDDDHAQRLVDFAAGLVFAARGTIERVTGKVFLLTPAHVDVAGEDPQRVAEGEFFNQS